MRIPFRSGLTAVAFLTLNLSALLWLRHELLHREGSETGPVRVVRTLPDSDIDTAERLAILFNQDLGEPALLNAAAASAVPFQLSPDVPGHWEWTSARRLEFALEDPLPPGRTFVVKPTDGLERQLGRVIQVDAEIAFRTRPLKLTDCRLVSADRTDVTFELVFNQNVSPAELLEHLQLDAQAATTENDRKNGIQALPVVNEPGRTIILRCRRPQSNQLLLRIDGGLSGSDGDRPLGKAASRTLKMDAIGSNEKLRTPPPRPDA